MTKRKRIARVQDPNVIVDPLLNVPEDTRTDREVFVDEFTQRYQDKNPREQADAIVWAIEEVFKLAGGPPNILFDAKEDDDDHQGKEE